MKNFRPQTGNRIYKSFNKHVNSAMTLLINHLRNKRYHDAQTLIRQNCGIINSPGDRGWTPFMALLSNVETIEDVKMIKYCLKYVNPNQINLNDMNYILIAIRHCAPGQLNLIFDMLHRNKINVYYETGDKLNALDLAIEMYHMSKGYEEDNFYLEMICKLIKNYKVKSNKYEILNYINEAISPWILDNLDCDNENYTIINDGISPAGSIVANVPNTENVILEYIPIKPDPNDTKRIESLNHLESLSPEELAEELISKLTNKRTDDVKYENKNKNMNKNIDENPNKKTQLYIIRFQTDCKSHDIPKCYRCDTSYKNTNFGIFRPCSHCIMCMDCIMKIHGENANFVCCVCDTTIESVVGRM